MDRPDPNVAVPRLTLGDDHMPALGLGTWRLSGAEGTRVIIDALEVGYRHLDTAQMYDNEACVGDAIVDGGVARTEIFLTTKIDDPNHHPDDVERSFEQSLRDLRVDHVDLLLLHWPVDWERIDETLQTMVSIATDGRASHLGVSNFEPDQMTRAAELAPVEVNQVEFHPLLDQRPVLDAAADLDMIVTAYCPIARGEVANDPACVSVARRHDASPAQVALAWLLRHGAVAAIPQTSKRDRLVENLMAVTLDLSDDDVAAIDATTKTKRLVSPPKSPWRRPGFERT